MLRAQIQEPCASPLESQQRSGRSGAAATDWSSMTWRPAWSFELNPVVSDMDPKIQSQFSLCLGRIGVNLLGCPNNYWKKGIVLGDC